MSSAPLIENYPGYPAILGSELANNMYEQAINLGVDIEIEEVKEINLKDKKIVVTDDNTYEAPVLIIATGAKYKLLNLEKEIDFIGKGIHFCVSCDGAFYKNKTVAVIGGGNSAVINAISLSDLCEKVYLIQNLSSLTAEEKLIDKLEEKNNIEVLFSATVEKLYGEDELKGILLKHNKEEEKLDLDGMFISIGMNPQNEIVSNSLKINDCGYILSENGTTDINGVFVAGDCRNKKVKQITVAVSDGTVAAINAIEYLNGLGS